MSSTHLTETSSYNLVRHVTKTLKRLSLSQKFTMTWVVLTSSIHHVSCGYVEGEEEINSYTHWSLMTITVRLMKSGQILTDSKTNSLESFSIAKKN